MKSKYYFLFVICVTSLSLLGSCKSSPIEKRATGLAYEIVVTMEKELWESEAGQAVKAELISPVLGLPQIEPSMRVTYAQPHDFNGLLTYVRNILIVNVNSKIYTKVSLSYENDRWTNGQVVVTLNSPDEASIITYLQENKRILVDYYTRVEMDRGAQLMEKTYSHIVHDTIKSTLSAYFKVPETMTYYRGGENFFWMSNNAPTGRTDAVIYTFPYTDSNTFTSEYLVAKRDSVMKINMPGAFPNSYMATENRFADVDYTPITVRNKYVGVLRGLWRMQGDMMGGPFVGHVRLDEVNNRVIVVEGFVYAPETDKRNYIRRIESALYTLRVPGEF